MQIYYTGDLIVPDGSDSNVYGDPCEPGEGQSLYTGWVDPDWSLWTVWENQEDVCPDTWTPDDGPMIDWAIERIADRLGYVEGTGSGGTFYAADSDQDYWTGKEMRLAAHVYGAPDPIVAAVEYGVTFANKPIH